MISITRIKEKYLEYDFFVSIDVDVYPSKREKMERNIETMLADPNIGFEEIAAYHDKMETLYPSEAYPGDWIVEDDKGNWHVEKGGEK